jgi:hypothetical protein
VAEVAGQHDFLQLYAVLYHELLPARPPEDDLLELLYLHLPTPTPSSS